jgi:hypothetical protein
MYHDHEASLADWICVLDLATRFGFRRVRERAKIEIGSDRFRRELGPVQKIVCAQTYDIQEWLLECYEALCQRRRGLEDNEAEALGATTTNRIWKAREAVRNADPRYVPETSSSQVPIDWDIKTYNTLTVVRIVKDVFEHPPPCSTSDPLPTNPVPLALDSTLEALLLTERKESLKERRRKKFLGKKGQLKKAKAEGEAEGEAESKAMMVEETGCGTEEQKGGEMQCN